MGTAHKAVEMIAGLWRKACVVVEHVHHHGFAATDAAIKIEPFRGFFGPIFASKERCEQIVAGWLICG